MSRATKGKKRIQVQVDQDLYDDVNEVLADIGISQATSIKALLKKLLQRGSTIWTFPVQQWSAELWDRPRSPNI